MSIHAIQESLIPGPLWQLGAGAAASLRAIRPSRLAVREGRAWVTWGDGCDRIVVAGEVLEVPAGAHVVVEPWQPCGAGVLRFGFGAA
ncbi:MAG: hypothetical protein C0451_03370 [Comamonadaceae bacterium]|jgi:hypothetical protein|nr:hypothetical protein [Comamonadaceae bacterium]